MKVLGIDPGTAATGFAVMDVTDASKPEILECSVVKTTAGVDMHLRLQQLHEDLMSISEKHTPDFMVIEKLFFNTNVKTAMSVGQARGVPLLVAASHSMQVIEYTALQAKLVLTGYGRSDKKEMQEAVKDYLKLDEVIKPDDANDAVAMVLCFLEKDLHQYNDTKTDK